MRAWTSPDVPRLGPRDRPEPVRVHDTATGAPSRPRDPDGAGPDVRLRHHAVRRHPPRPRRDLHRLRPAQPGLARRRPRGALRAERHRRRRPAAGAGHRDRRRLGRARRARDRAVPRGHDRAAGARARRTTSARSSRSRSSSSWSSSCRSRGVVYDVDGDLYFSVHSDPRFGHGVAASTRPTMLAVFGERGGDPDRPGKKHPLDCLLWQAERPGRAGLGHRARPRPSRLAHRVLGDRAAPPRRRRSTCRAAAATWSSRTTR